MQGSSSMFLPSFFHVMLEYCNTSQLESAQGRTLHQHPHFSIASTTHVSVSPPNLYDVINIATGSKPQPGRCTQHPLSSPPMYERCVYVSQGLG